MPSIKLNFAYVGYEKQIFHARVCMESRQHSLQRASSFLIPFSHVQSFEKRILNPSFLDFFVPLFWVLWVVLDLGIVPGSSIYRIKRIN